MKNKTETIVVGGGCFWCTEAVFQEIKGVTEVVSGYSGGNAPGVPTYREICSGLTGHAEVVKITFNTCIISTKEILEVFMTTHDPTTLNRQGADRGTQYRSVIFFKDNSQKAIAKDVISRLSNFYDEKIVTELSPFTVFYKAEEAHQNYYKNNTENGYCSIVISPKLKKLRELHAKKVTSCK